MRMRGIWLLLCTLAVAADVQASSTVHYVLLVDNGTLAGEQTVEHGDDGATNVHYAYKPHRT